VADAPVGTEWIVDAHGCEPASLQSCSTLARLFAQIVQELDLHPVREPMWHVFPGEGGVTGVLVLTESHLTCHTFPEVGFAAFDLFCCRGGREWPWAARLRETLGATEVSVRSVSRGGD